MMNDAFESVLQQTALVRSRIVKRKLEVSFCEVRELRHMRSDWGAAVEEPHDSDLVSPSGYALFQSLEQIYCCARILRSNTPKRYVDITQNPHHRLWRMVGPEIYQQSPMRGPVLEDFLANIAALATKQLKRDISIWFPTLVVAGNTRRFVQVSQSP